MPVLSLQAPVMLLDKLRHWGTLTTTMDMALIVEVEELQSFCSTFSKDLVLLVHLVAATELIDGSSTFTGHQVCAFKPKQICVPKHWHYPRLQFQQHDSQLSVALCSREWSSECDWSPTNCGQVQLPWGNSAWTWDEDMSGKWLVWRGTFLQNRYQY